MAQIMHRAHNILNWGQKCFNRTIGEGNNIVLQSHKEISLKAMKKIIKYSNKDNKIM